MHRADSDVWQPHIQQQSQGVFEYVLSRMGATYSRLSLSDDIPLFDTLDDWQRHGSTKLDTCAKMCQHILSRDDAPDMIFEDGQVTFPDLPMPKAGEKLSQERKILIYCIRNSLALDLCFET